MDYSNINDYSDVVSRGLILPRKEKYTLRDVHKVMTDSLFDGGETCSLHMAGWIVICSSVYHNTNYAKSVEKVRATLYPVF